MIEEIDNNNPRLMIEKIKMNTDHTNKKIVEPLPQYNFFSCLIGSAGSGKTNLLMNLINKRNKGYFKCFDNVYIYSPSTHTIGDKIKLDDDKIKNTLDIEELDVILANIKKIVIENHKYHTLFVFDDLITSIKSNIDVFLKMIFNRRQYNISVFLISQKYNKIPLELRTAMSHLYLFKPSNKKEYDNIYDELITINRDDFDNIVNYVFDKRYNFLFVDISTNTFYKNFNLLKLQ